MSSPLDVIAEVPRPCGLQGMSTRGGVVDRTGAYITGRVEGAPNRLGVGRSNIRHVVCCLAFLQGRHVEYARFCVFPQT